MKVPLSRPHRMRTASPAGGSASVLAMGAAEMTISPRLESAAHPAPARINAATAPKAHFQYHLERDATGAPAGVFRINDTSSAGAVETSGGSSTGDVAAGAPARETNFGTYRPCATTICNSLWAPWF